MSFIISLKKLVSMFLTIFMLILSVNVTGEPLKAENPDEVKLNFTVFSDCHIEGNNLKTYQVLTKMLMSADKNETENDAAVFLGDNTMNGQDIESMFFYGLVNAVKPAEEILVASGNHDFGNGEGNFNQLVNRFKDYNNMFFEPEMEELYYYRVINGCYFIVLSTEDHTVNTSYLSEEQLTWLRGVLDEAAESGNPIFVFHHYPIYYLEGDQYVLSEILNDYDNLLYFCGHTHLEMTKDSFSNFNGVDTVWLPKSTEHVYEDYDCGVGVQVEVYENEVLVRARSFYEDRWIEGLEYRYPVG